MHVLGFLISSLKKEETNFIIPSTIKNDHLSLTDKVRHTAAKVSSYNAIEKVAQASVTASVLCGTAMIACGNGSQSVLDGMVTATIGSAAALAAWGVAALVHGKRNKGIKCFLLGTALFALGVKINSTIFPKSTLVDFHSDANILQRIKSEIAEKSSELESLNNMILELQEVIGGKNNEIISLEKPLEKLNKDLSNKKIDLRVTEKELEQKKIELTDLRDEIKKITREIISIYGSKNELIRKKNHEVQSYKKKLTLLKDRVKNMREHCYFWSSLPSENELLAIEPWELSKRKIIFGTTYIKGNNLRNYLYLINQNQKKYADAWHLTHRVVEESLLQKECLDEKTNTLVDCVPYWNKVAVLREWLKEPAQDGEEWYILADDDMPVTDMRVDPYNAIDLLRRGKDTSIIIAEDVVPWKNGNPQLSVNTGLMFVRRDEASKKFIEELWEKRNTRTEDKKYSEICPTLGTCKNQDTLHEQEAFAQVLESNPALIDEVVTVVKPRDTYGETEIAINTFYREGCFIRKQENWKEERIHYDFDKKFPHGKWREGDWMGQTAGVPAFGWWCGDFDNNEPPGPIREDKLKQMLAKVIEV